MKINKITFDQDAVNHKITEYLILFFSRYLSRPLVEDTEYTKQHTTY